MACARVLEAPTLECMTYHSTIANPVGHDGRAPRSMPRIDMLTPREFDQTREPIGGISTTSGKVNFLVSVARRTTYIQRPSCERRRLSHAPAQCVRPAASRTCSEDADEPRFEVNFVAVRPTGPPAPPTHHNSTLKPHHPTQRHPLSLSTHVTSIPYKTSWPPPLSSATQATPSQSRVQQQQQQRRVVWPR